MASIPTSGGIYRRRGSYGRSPVPTVSQTQYNTLKSQYDALNNNYNNLNNQYNTYLNKYNTLNNEYNSLQNQYKQATADKSVFTMNVGDNQYTAAQQRYNPQATLTQVAQQNALSNPNQMSNINLQQYYDPTKLQEDIYKGIQTAVRQEREDAQNRLNSTLANTGLFRSGINLENQQKLERSAMDALAKGYGDTALNVAQLQSDFAKTQGAMDLDVSKYNADIQNAFKTKNYDYLMNAAAQDQEAINQASQFNIQIKNAYDEMAFKWMASLLDKEIRDYQTTMDAFKTAYGATLQYGSDTAKENLNKLGFEKALADRLGLDTSGLFTPTTTTGTTTPNTTTTDTTTSPTDNITNTRSNSFLWDDHWKRMGYQSYSDYSNDKA